MKNCELAIGILVGIAIGKACENLTPKQPIKPVLPCEREAHCECLPPKKPDCKSCYYKRYKRC